MIRQGDRLGHAHAGHVRGLSGSLRGTCAPGSARVVVHEERDDAAADDDEHDEHGAGARR